jgi:protein ImuB
MWERANGQSQRLLKLVRPAESFEENFEFEHEIETAEPLLFMLRRFLEHLAIRLDAIYLVAKELTLQITFANSPRNGSTAAAKKCYERVFKIPQPTNDIDLLFRMLQTHLENFRSEYPIIAVALRAQPVKPPAQQFGLFETTLRNPHQLSETLARLIGLLGSDRVGTPVLEETHRPDAFRMEPFDWSNTGRQDAHLPHSQDGCATKTALRRFRPALSASVFLNETTPAHIRAPEIAGEIIDEMGPYPLSGNWWDEKSWTRIEWDFELESGELVRAHQSNSGWKVDGIYD